MIDSKSCMLNTYKLPFQRYTSFLSASCSASALLAGSLPELQCEFKLIYWKIFLLAAVFLPLFPEALSTESAVLCKKELVEPRLFSAILVLFHNKTWWEKDWSVKYLHQPFLPIVCCQNKMFLSILLSFVLHGFRQGLNLILSKGNRVISFTGLHGHLISPKLPVSVFFAMEAESLGV